MLVALLAFGTLALLNPALPYPTAQPAFAAFRPRPAARLRPRSPALAAVSKEAAGRGSEAAALTRPRAVTGLFTLRVTAALVCSVGAFSLAFVLIERWTFIDAFYFVTTTLTTIGFGAVRPLTFFGSILTCLLGCFGVGLLGGLVSRVVDEFMQPEIQPLAPEAEWARERARLRLAWWAQVGVLLGIGTLGLKLCDRGMISWPKAVYVVFAAMTTVGLGDVVPSTAAAKLFIGFYSPFAVITFARVVGSLAVRPVEAARRAAQRAVLERYGSELTQETLAEVASGPVVKRLDLSSDDRFCSRDEFTLLTLVLQGKVSEADLSECRATFRKLDVDGSGQLSVEDLEVLAEARMIGLLEQPPEQDDRRRLSDLDADGSGRLSVEDLEVLAEARMIGLLRPQPPRGLRSEQDDRVRRRLRRRLFARVRSAFGLPFR